MRYVLERTGERGLTMDEATFEKKLNELVKEIGSIPAPQRSKLIMLAKQTRDCHKRLRKSVDSLQESLDYLRVSIKYMLLIWRLHVGKTLI